MITTFAKSTTKMTGIYRARVEGNNDPEKLGRIRARIYPAFSDIDDINTIPWAVPAFGLWEGAGTNVGSFTVPDVGTFVFCFFEAGDVNQPVYFAEAQTAVHGLPDSRVTNYPDRKVWRTSAGIEIYIDDIDEEIKITHPAEATVVIDKDGNINVNTVGNISVSADGTVDVHGEGNVTVSSTQEVIITGAAVRIN